MISISYLCLILTRNMSRYPDAFDHLLVPFILPAVLSSKETLKLSGRPSLS